MNEIPQKALEKANREAIYNLYLYLANKTPAVEGERMRSALSRLTAAMRLHKPAPWSAREVRRLHILNKAAEAQPILADTVIGNITRSRNGMTACSFTRTDGGISVVFKGTGGGEWIDNGEGLSGIPEENTYITYSETRGISLEHISEDHATDQQVEALNWFRYIAAVNGWNEQTMITLSGHSKGGNKAQFVTIHSKLVRDCYSFDGQGFSPEALSALRNRIGAEFDSRSARIKSISADNDYVNVLGQRLMPEEQIYYFESAMGLHYMEAILDDYGRLRAQSTQGRLSRYIESVSEKLMNTPPQMRKYATLGVMNLFQKYLGEGEPVNGDTVSFEQTIAGIALAIGPLLGSL